MNSNTGADGDAGREAQMRWAVSYIGFSRLVRSRNASRAAAPDLRNLRATMRLARSHDRAAADLIPAFCATISGTASSPAAGRSFSASAVFRTFDIQNCLKQGFSTLQHDPERSKCQASGAAPVAAFSLNQQFARVPPTLDRRHPDCRRRGGNLAPDDTFGVNYSCSPEQALATWILLNRRKTGIETITS